MIVWLASYPRSGNTLLRTVLRRCFGLCSHEDVPIDRPGEFRDNPDMIGHVEKQEAWEDFYGKALASPELSLVKTHLPPRDEQPFIYVVRDGRLSVTSYRKFHRDYNGIDKSIASLIIGDDVCGDWTTHYRVWNDRSAPERLVLRFEELVNVSEEVLARIACFIRFTGEIAPWENPIGRLREVEPDFFNRAETRFAADPEWGLAERFLFERFHGELMRGLGYENDLSCVHLIREVPGEFLAMAEEMVTLLRRLSRENHERLTSIHDLDRRLKAMAAVRQG
ncbi:sulfotransferase domain-containing protein [Desulfococcus sp.]|uniref:sulfotransferase domain-containing protein n=1 Tax=Desulfococcus sp. TaxID=2025834 RepID=UPI0035934880